MTTKLKAMAPFLLPPPNIPQTLQDTPSLWRPSFSDSLETYSLYRDSF